PKRRDGSGALGPGARRRIRLAAGCPAVSLPTVACPFAARPHRALSSEGTVILVSHPAAAPAPGDTAPPGSCATSSGTTSPAVIGMLASTCPEAGCAECSVGFAALALRHRSDGVERGG